MAPLSPAALFEMAQEALLEKHDADTAIEWLEKASQAGDLNAQQSLGRLYLWRDDLAKARQWLTLAAHQGCTESAMLLVSHVLNPQDPQQADEIEKWRLFAAEEGHPIACQNMGVHCYQGIKKAPDIEKALDWFKEAAIYEPTSAIAVALILEEGNHPNFIDPNEPFLYWEKAAKGGQPDAMIMVSDCYRQGRYVAMDLEKAQQWREIADSFNPELPQSHDDLDMNRVVAVLRQIYLGTLLSTEIKPVFERLGEEEMSEDSREAPFSMDLSSTVDKLRSLAHQKALSSRTQGKVDLARRAQYAAEAGEPEAQYFYGRLLLEGKQVLQDIEKAQQWLTRSARTYSTAQFFLAGLYRHGFEAVTSDLERAISWLQKAAEAHFYPAQYYLGLHAYVHHELPTAFQWFKKVAIQAHAMEQHYHAQWKQAYFGPCHPDERASIEKQAKNRADNDPLLGPVELGLMYEHFADQADLTEAEKNHYYQQAAKAYHQAKNHLTGRFRLGLLTLMGRGVAQDTHQAFDHIRAASQNWSEIKGYQQEHIPMLSLPYYLGHFYEEGLGCASHKGFALNWYQKCARNLVLKTIQPQDDFWGNPQALHLNEQMDNER